MMLLSREAEARQTCRLSLHKPAMSATAEGPLYGHRTS